MKYVPFVLLALAAPAAAGSYYPGTVRDGYTFQSGYWYRGNTPYYSYAHTAYNYVPYSSYGQTYYYQQPYTYYTYEAVPAADYQKPAAPTPPANWKSELLKLAGARDDQLGYLNALRALGLPQPLQAPAQGPYQSAAPYNGVPYTQNAQTQYGYSYSSIKDVYGDTNLGTLYQQAARLTQNAQSLAGQAQGDFSTLLQQEGGNRSRVAEILAKAQAASAALRAAEAAPSTTVTSSASTSSSASVVGSTATGGGEGGPIPVDPGQAQQQYNPGQQAPTAAAGSDQAFAALLTNRCSSCHSGQDPAGKMVLTPQSYAAMSLTDKARRVWPTLTDRDSHRRMPKGKTPLAPEELRAFYTH